MNYPILKSSLSKAQQWLVELLQANPFGRIENLHVRAGEPIFAPAPRIIAKLRIGGSNGPRPEAELPDFWLKKSVVELLETIADLGDGEIQTIEVAHGLPFVVEIERPVFTGGCSNA